MKASQLLQIALETRWKGSEYQTVMNDQIQRIIKEVGDKTVDQMWTDKAVDALSRIWSNPTTAKRVGNNLRSMINCGKRYRHIDRSILVELPHPQQKRREFLPPEVIADIDRIWRKHVPGTNIVYRLIRDLGLRGVGQELINLRWDDLTASGFMRVRSMKGGTMHERRIPVPDDLRDALECSRQKNSDPIVTDIQVEHFKFWWKHAVRKHYPDAVPYQLRHAYATRLLSGGVSIHLTKEVMGHRKLDTTLHYAHVIEQDMQKIKDLQ